MKTTLFLFRVFVLFYYIFYFPMEEPIQPYLSLYFAPKFYIVIT